MWLVIGAIVLYISGATVFSLVTSNTLAASFAFVVVPFIPTEIVKIVLVVVFTKLIKQALEKSGMLV